MKAITVLVEPFPDGHRAQAVANVAAVASLTSEILILTSRGGTQDPSYIENLGHLGYRVLEPFDEVFPRTIEVARVVAGLCRTEDIGSVVVMDADQALKRWWWDAPRAFGLRRRPRVIFMLTRYPAKLRLTDWGGWKLRLPKATLALMAMASGSLHRVAGFAGRDDMSPGWVVKRTRDPAICSAHSRDRAALRAEFEIDQQRRVVGIFGGISERKNAQLVWEAMQARGIEADLLLAGELTPGVAAWVDSVESSRLGGVIVHNGFLTNVDLDKLVAACNVAALIMTNNGPSGIMGKSLAAEVPVVTAGSEVRARELRATDGGELADFDRDSIGAALERALRRDPTSPRRNRVPPATAEEFARSLLGPPLLEDHDGLRKNNPSA